MNNQRGLQNDHHGHDHDKNISKDPPMEISGLPQIEYSWDNVDLVVKYLADTETVEYTTTVPNGRWFAIGYGTNMVYPGMDTLTWSANGSQSKVTDGFASGHFQPTKDANGNTSDFTYDSVAQTVTFVTQRPLDTQQFNDYLIPVDELLQLSYATNSNTHLESKKHTDQGFWSMHLLPDGTIAKGDDDITSIELGFREPWFEKHGWYLWSAWTIGGFLLILTKRHLKQFVIPAHILHFVVATYTTVMLLVWGLGAYKHQGWKVTPTPHSWIATFMMAFGLFMFINGIALMNFAVWKKEEWTAEEKQTFIARIHRRVGYFTLFFAQVTVLSGYLHYIVDWVKMPKYVVWGIVNLLVWIIALVLLEICLRVQRRRSKLQPQPTRKDLKAYTPEQVDQEVKEGKQLMIMDQYVIDAHDFGPFHPGGKFVITHNLGRDISKFFYGGYNMFPGAKIQVTHLHTKKALDTVNRMIVGYIKAQDSVQVQTTVLAEKFDVNVDTKTYIFKSVDKKPVPNFKKWYSDPNMIGKHFLVNGVQDVQAKRHYTICNSMRPDILAHLLQVAEGGTVDQSALDDTDCDEIALTSKNYNVIRKKYMGVATQFWKSENAQFEIKGPMGKGLQLKQKGLHMAFVGGTGALVFLDLVAAVLLDNKKNSDNVFDPEFKFHLFASFASREQAIGLKLMEAVEKATASKGNFKLTLRISNENKPPRWDNEWITKTMGENPDVVRAWVCGPPIMNETFDKQFGVLMKKPVTDEKTKVQAAAPNGFNLSKEDIEIM